MQQQTTMEVKSSLRQVKTQFLLLDILYKIGLGETPYEIQKRYGWSRQRIHYFISKLRNAGYIELITRSNISIYDMTPLGKNFYTGYVEKIQGTIRLHNVAFTYPILSQGTLVADKEWFLKGLNQHLKKESNASIVWNPKSMTIFVGSLVGTDAFALFEKARKIADDLKEGMKASGFELGEGRLSRQPHFAVINPVAEQISKSIQFSSEDAKIDRSEGSGELEYFSPEKVDAYIRMPERLITLETHILKQDAILEGFSKNIALHLEVLQQMNATLKKIQEAKS